MGKSLQELKTFIFIVRFWLYFLVCDGKGSIGRSSPAKRDRPTRLDFCQLRIFCSPNLMFVPSNIASAKKNEGRESTIFAFVIRGNNRRSDSDRPTQPSHQ